MDSAVGVTLGISIISVEVGVMVDEAGVSVGLGVFSSIVGTILVGNVVGELITTGCVATSVSIRSLFVGSLVGCIGSIVGVLSLFSSCGREVAFLTGVVVLTSALIKLGMTGITVLPGDCIVGGKGVEVAFAGIGEDVAVSVCIGTINDAVEVRVGVNVGLIVRVTSGVTVRVDFATVLMETVRAMAKTISKTTAKEAKESQAELKSLGENIGRVLFCTFRLSARAACMTSFPLLIATGRGWGASIFCNDSASNSKGRSASACSGYCSKQAATLSPAHNFATQSSRILSNKLDSIVYHHHSMNNAILFFKCFLL